MVPTRTGSRRVERARVGRDPALDRFAQSLARSRSRRQRWIFASRRRTRRRRIALAAAAAGIAAAAGVALVAVEPGSRPAAAALGAERAGPYAATADRPHRGPGSAGGAPARSAVPEAAAIESAWSYARERGGLVSIAVIDSRGRFHGLDSGRAYASASIVKALLLAAELRRLEAAGAPLDAATRGLLTQMVTISDNDAADAIYYRVGDAGLQDVAGQAGMEAFSVAGYWGNAQVTAADMARFMWRIEDVLAGPHREFALGLLGSIAPSQSWGIPAGAGERWSARFKGGWRTTELGALVHQAAELRRGGDRVAIAVLSDGQPSHAYATETLSGIADRLVGRMSSEPWDGRWR
jgi:Beta-lactamase enzyme family